MDRFCQSCGLDPVKNPNLPASAPTEMRELHEIPILLGIPGEKKNQIGRLKLCSWCCSGLREHFLDPYKEEHGTRLGVLEGKLAEIKAVIERQDG